MNNFSQFESFQLLQEHTEARLWVEYTIQHTNPVMRQVGIFLISFYALDGIADTGKISKMEGLALNLLEVYETECWVLYFKNHPLDGLQEVSEWMPQWMGLNTAS